MQKTTKKLVDSHHTNGDTVFESTLGSEWSIRRTMGLMQRPSRPIWRRATVLAMRCEVPGQALWPWMPRIMRPPQNANVILFAANFEDTSFGISYRELGLLVETRYFGKPVFHCPWMLVNDDSALLQGRELFGFPKKMAQFSETKNGDSTNILVQRRGVELFSLSATIGEQTKHRGVFTRPIVNVRGLPGPTPPVLMYCKSSETIHQTHSVNATLKIQSSLYDPLDTLNLPEKPLECWQSVIDVAPGKKRLGELARQAFPVGIASPLWFTRVWPLRTW